jgi:hypothetical protein
MKLLAAPPFDRLRTETQEVCSVGGDFRPAVFYAKDDRAGNIINLLKAIPIGRAAMAARLSCFS